MIPKKGWHPSLNPVALFLICRDYGTLVGATKNLSSSALSICSSHNLSPRHSQFIDCHVLPYFWPFYGPQVSTVDQASPSQLQASASDRQPSRTLSKLSTSFNHFLIWPSHSWFSLFLSLFFLLHLSAGSLAYLNLLSCLEILKHLCCYSDDSLDAFPTYRAR